MTGLNWGWQCIIKHNIILISKGILRWRGLCTTMTMWILLLYLFYMRFFFNYKSLQLPPWPFQLRFSIIFSPIDCARPPSLHICFISHLQCAGLFIRLALPLSSFMFTGVSCMMPHCPIDRTTNWAYSCQCTYI